MKKNLIIKAIAIVILVFNVSMLSGCTTITVDKVCVNNVGARTLDYNEVKDSLIRFHVIANSDNDQDQQLKLKVKNKIIEYLYPFLSNSKSLDDSRKIIIDNMDKVKRISEEIIRQEGYDYDVDLQLSRENFPDKSYGNIILPQGNYEAFRVIIGKGQGRNWWCVMFPPLCFVDESKAEVEYDKVEENIKKEQENKIKDFDSDENSSENNNNDKIQVKFKVVEVVQNLFK